MLHLVTKKYNFFSFVSTDISLLATSSVSVAYTLKVANYTTISLQKKLAANNAVLVSSLTAAGFSGTTVQASVVNTFAPTVFPTSAPGRFWEIVFYLFIFCVFVIPFFFFSDEFFLFFFSAISLPSLNTPTTILSLYIISHTIPITPFSHLFYPHLFPPLFSAFPVPFLIPFFSLFF